MPKPILRRLAFALLLVALLGTSLLAGYLAFLQWRASSGASGVAGLPSVPMPGKEPEVTLTKAEAAALEGQLRGLVMEVMVGGCQIDKITKDADGYVLHCKTKDSVVIFHVQKNTEQGGGQERGAAK